MAKKKSKNEDTANVETEEVSKALTVADITKQFGDNVIVNGSHIVNRPRQIIPVSPKIDLMLNGGIPEGSFIIPTGAPKIGKSSLSLDFASSVLEVPSNWGERIVYIFNIEGRLNARDLVGIKGLNQYITEPKLQHRIQIIESRPGRILAGEEYLEIGEALINEKPGCIFIFDSFSQLCSSERKRNKFGKRFRDDMPLYLADFCKRICNVIPINNSFVVGITHRIANQSPGAKSPWMEASGQKIQYEVDVKLNAKFKQDWKAGDTQIGQDVHWECDASPIGPPGRTCVSKLRYGHGLDKEAELLEVCADLMLIPKNKNWYEINGKSYNGIDQARSFLIENPDLYKKYYTEFRSMMGFKC